MNIKKWEVILEKFLIFMGGGFISLFGTFDSAFAILVYFMILDYFIGVTLSMFGYSKKTENGKIESNQIFKGIIKKVTVLVMISISYQIGKIMNFESLRNIVIFGFITFELASLLEHAVKVGVKLPKVLTDILEVMKTKEQEGLKNE